MKAFFFISLALIVVSLLGLYFLFSNIPNPTFYLASTRQTAHGKTAITFNPRLTPDKLATAVQHETIHALKQIGTFDLDLPMAPAMGYFSEYHTNHRIADPIFQQPFLQGFNDNSDSIAWFHTADSVINHSVNSKEENFSVYSDAALLAGLMYKHTSGNINVFRKYISSLCIFANHEEAYAASQSYLFDVINNFHDGHYNDTTTNRFNILSFCKDTLKLTPFENRLLFRYMSRIMEPQPRETSHLLDSAITFLRNKNYLLANDLLIGILNDTQVRNRQTLYTSTIMFFNSVLNQQRNTSSAIAIINFEMNRCINKNPVLAYVVNKHHFLEIVNKQPEAFKGIIP